MNVSDETLYSLPRCSFVKNFHASSARNWSKKIGLEKDSQNSFCKKNAAFQVVWIFYSEREIGIYNLIFLHEMLFNNLFGGNFEGSLVTNFSKKVVRGNSVQTDPNFPAKSLSIHEKFLFNDLTEN